MTNTKNDRVFRMDCGLRHSGWKVWQKACFEKASEYDGFLFTQEDIEDLRAKLNEIGAGYRNSLPVEGCTERDYEWSDTHDLNPCLVIGEGCYIRLNRIKGVYGK